MKIDILGVKIDKVNLTEALVVAEKWIRNKSACRTGKHYIVTPNLEFILAAQKDKEFRGILNKADLAIPDSSSLGLSDWLLRKSRLERLLLWPLFFFPVKPMMQFDVVTGTDFMEALCKLSAEKGFTTGFLGGNGGVAKETAERLLRKYPNLKVSYVSSGGIIDKDGNPQEVVSSKYYVAREKAGKDMSSRNTKYIIPPTDILFVAFGHIKQEKWIAKNLDKIPVRVAMGVGGAFDYLSGRVRRAPKMVRKSGFEWLFRLVIQPWRIKRQLVLFKYLRLILFYDQT
ncbi:MAG: WecB/TagA/CpsF family glycosyltransferase [Candidatus Daviesbacteria bacterium]|nr:WecB/TagA/CpsF family glycosyltransferase [Candidatus Daviesbacteria bacterium]